MKLSQKLQRERAYVERVLGDKVICDRCKAKLADYTLICTADLSDLCPGFMAIEAAKRQFAQEEAEAGR